MPAEAPTMVDWTLARSTATRLVKAGPAISADGALATVAELREAAARAERYVTEVTGLDASSGTAPVLVVDRPGWIQANLDAFRLLLTPLTDLAASKVTSPRATSLGSRVTGAEVGVLLSYLAPKVLGQFDPFWTGPDGAQGRLLLVAPNVVEIERLLRVPPSDFRLWVCLHEETHRVQFTAVPWLRDHLLGLIARLVATADFDSGVLAAVVREAVRRIVEGIREGEELSVVDLVQTPAQRTIVDEITAVMSLLEGHADVVMDSVGPEVVPSVAQIRAKFDVRRQGQPGPDRVVRRLLGLDAKMRQYRDGAAFCRHVLDEVGMTGLNRVWTSPDTLPSRAEIANPQLWVIRNHPEPATPAAG
ncbi:MAG TPA: zinc-dependent metalloprotease [Friedmanniella sp.]